MDITLTDSEHDRDAEEDTWPVLRDCTESGLEEYHMDIHRIVPATIPYKPLDKNRKEIRLLRVHAARPGRDEDSLSCTLEQAFLDDSAIPEYETVSYCWGYPINRRPIILNGRVITIPTSARAALHRMRRQDADRLLWIDAVCVNQDDPEERGHQVNMMYDIYSNGQGNLIYLGEEDRTTAQAQGMIRRILDDAIRETNNYENWQDTLRDEAGERIYLTEGMPFDVDLESLVQFYSAPWFTRLWVVQEVALSKNNTWYFGPSSGNMKDALQAAEWFAYKMFEGPVHIKDTTCFNRAVSLNRYCEPVQPGDRSRYLISLVLSLQYFNVTDTRDSIYALLGLHCKLNRTTLVDQVLEPDYGTALAAVLQEATRFMMWEHGDLYVLEYWGGITSGSHLRSDLPTWVPHWHALHDIRRDRIASQFSGLSESFSACNRRELDVFATVATVEGPAPDELILKGYTIDAVATASSVSSKTNLQSVDTTVQIIEEIEALAASYCVTDRPRIGLGATLIADMNAWDKRATEADCAGFECWIAHLKDKGEFPPDIRSLDGPPAVHDRLVFDASAYGEAAYRVMIDRRFFVTESGLIGLGPAELQIDDKIVILFGLNVPAVLRKQQDHYRFIGVSYVDGIMDGEAVEKFEAEGRPPELFALI